MIDLYPVKNCENEKKPMITGPFRPHPILRFIVHFNDHPSVHLSAVREFRGSLFSKIKQNDVCALNLKAQPATIILFNEALLLRQSYYLIADFAFSSKILMLTEQKLLLNQNSLKKYFELGSIHEYFGLCRK